MISCYIIDDESHAIETISAYITKTPDFEILGSHDNPLEALAFFKKTNTYADITFLDIDMPQISGIEVSSILKGHTKIIFTTAFPNFALDAFELDVNDFLLKPFSYERFLKSIYKVQDLLKLEKNATNKNYNNYLFIQTEGKGKMVKIYNNEILYIESQKNYLSIATVEKKVLTYLTLSEIGQRLSSAFIRIHKSYIINADKISHIEGNDVFLHGLKESFPIGISYKSILAQYVKDYVVKTNRSL
jgi:DNA-binding LytR/AlgR family response regulator